MIKLPIHRLVMVLIVGQITFTHLSLEMDFAFSNETRILGRADLDRLPLLRLLSLQIVLLADEADCVSGRPIVFVLASQQVVVGGARESVVKAVGPWGPAWRGRIPFVHLQNFC
jgi:hypothetical protein